MKLSIVLGSVGAVIAWLGLWATSTGLLIYSSDIGLGSRGCGYLVGVTIMKRLQPFSQGCPLIRKFG